MIRSLNPKNPPLRMQKIKMSHQSTPSLPPRSRKDLEEAGEAGSRPTCRTCQTCPTRRIKGRRLLNLHVPPRAPLASLQDARALVGLSPVVSLRSTTGYRLGSLRERVAFLPPRASLASLREAAASEGRGPVVSLRSTTGYTLGSLRERPFRGLTLCRRFSREPAVFQNKPFQSLVFATSKLYPIGNASNLPAAMNPPLPASPCIRANRQR